MRLDISKIADVEVNGVDHRDYPDFCDAFISNATYDGVPMTDEQLDAINDNRDFVYQAVLNSIY